MMKERYVPLLKKGGERTTHSKMLTTDLIEYLKPNNISA
jgi:hypothetical protein